MRTIRLLITATACLTLLLTSCNSKRYNPPEPITAYITPSSSLDQLDSIDVKLTIMVQEPLADLPATATQALTSRLLTIASSNGIAGYGGEPGIVLAALVTPTGKDVTATAPAKHVAKYTLNIYVANLASGDVYGSYSADIMGVGKSFDLASVNAMNSVKNNNSIQSMLKTAKQRIIDWYVNHSDDFQATVNSYIANGDYEKAYALLNSVPRQATSCHEFALKNRDLIYREYLQQKSIENHNRMVDEIAKAGSEYSPTVGAYLQLIPVSAPVYETAKKDYDNYLSRIAQEKQQQQDREFYLEKERIEAQKLEIEAQIRASEALRQDSEADAAPVEASNSIISQIVNQAVNLGIQEIIGFIL